MLVGVGHFAGVTEGARLAVCPLPGQGEQDPGICVQSLSGGMAVHVSWACVQACSRASAHAQTRACVYTAKSQLPAVAVNAANGQSTLSVPMWLWEIV